MGEALTETLYAFERLDQCCAREGGWIFNGGNPEQRASVAGDVAANDYTTVGCGSHAHVVRISRSNRLRLYVDVVWGDLRSPRDRFWCLSDLSWCDLHVDQVVVYRDRVWPGIEVWVRLPARGWIEEPIVDDDVSICARDAVLTYLLRDLVEPR